MTINAPTSPDLSAVARDIGLELTDSELEEYREILAGFVGPYQLVESLDEAPPPPRYPRDGGWVPTPAENPYNAWYVRTSIKGAEDGKLAGRPVAVKDTVCLAGVPMMNGASFLEGYVPELDATVVTRLLDAGAEIVGKTNCEYLSCSGNSHTCANGPVINPRRPGYSAGGSSSGSAAVLAAGDVDLALGGDQAGSIRMPAALCGVYGLKPTYGLVPYTGVMGIEFSIDHVGPMTNSVADNALMLEVLAGPDGIDVRQPRDWKPVAYTQAADDGVAGLKIGLVPEGFGRDESDPAVDAAVRTAADALAKLGAGVDEVSIPLHTQAAAIGLPLLIEGPTAAILSGGYGFNHQGLALTSLVERMGTLRQRAAELPANIVSILLFGHYVNTQYPGQYYARTQNLRRRLRAAYDEALTRYDLLLMPTTQTAAGPLPPSDADKATVVGTAFGNIENTGGMDFTGHPALSVPCGTTDGLPVGMMLIGRHFDEYTIYRAAYQFEAHWNWAEH